MKGSAFVGLLVLFLLFILSPFWIPALLVALAVWLK
jgi:hypothetical protein